VANQNEIRQQITNQIIVALESNQGPFWRRPWRTSLNAGRPTNVTTHKTYNGINPLLLELHSYKFGFQSKFWGTFNQWQELGCTVKRRPNGVESGEWGAKIVLYKPLHKKVVDQTTGDEEERDFLMMRTFSVFNAEQVEGEAADKFLVKEDGELITFPDYQPFEELVAATKADIRHGGEKAFYRRPSPIGSFPNHTDGDFIVVPERHRFESSGAYYETLAHELSHWSEIRLNWEGTYAMGELIAEISSTYLCHELGVPNANDLTNHASYLQSWIKEMKGDPSFIFKASTQASKTTEFLLSFVRKDLPVEATN